MTKTTARRVMAEAKREFRCHKRLSRVEEHGGDYLQCLDCGALWSIAFDGAGHPLFDVLEDGDEWCSNNG